MAVRKRASAMTTAEQQRFVNTITQLNLSGEYGKIVAIHANMMHRMHSSMGPVGNQRFLPWHRLYLHKVEQAMQSIDSQAFIPLALDEGSRRPGLDARVQAHSVGARCRAHHSGSKSGTSGRTPQTVAHYRHSGAHHLHSLHHRSRGSAAQSRAHVAERHHVEPLHRAGRPALLDASRHDRPDLVPLASETGQRRQDVQPGGQGSRT